MTGDSDSIYYDIETEYGHDIDPVRIKTSEFKFDRDSIITDYRINETKHYFDGEKRGMRITASYPQAGFLASWTGKY